MPKYFRIYVIFFFASSLMFSLSCQKLSANARTMAFVHTKPLFLFDSLQLNSLLTDKDTTNLDSVSNTKDSINAAEPDSLSDSLVPFADFKLISPIKFRTEADSIFINENPPLLHLCLTLLTVLVEYDKPLLLNNAPKYEDYLLFIDSTDADQYPEVMKRYRFKVFESTLNKQYKRLRKDAQELKVSFRRAQPRLFFLEHGIHPEYNKAFCYINLEFRIKKKDLIRVRILALKMGENWYFADDLALIAK